MTTIGTKPFDPVSERITGDRVCRVRERPCDRSLPSEPDMMVSSHPAQAVAKPWSPKAGFGDGFVSAVRR
jgi:hypothetical protein